MTKYIITFKDAGGSLGEYPWETDIEEPTLSDAQSAMNVPVSHAEIISITPVDPPKVRGAIPQKETPPKVEEEKAPAKAEAKVEEPKKAAPSSHTAHTSTSSHTPSKK